MPSSTLIENDVPYASYNPPSRSGRLRICLAASCTGGSLACATYALVCGLVLRDWPERNTLPLVVHPWIFIAVGALGLISATSMGVYAYTTRPQRTLPN